MRVRMLRRKKSIMTVKEKIDSVVEELGCVGIVPVIKLDKVENAEKLAKAQNKGV